MTKLFHSIIVGPIHSRRLGSSLGINLLPEYGKLCSFDCIYCECGWNKDGTKDRKLPSAQDVETELSARLQELAAQKVPVDSITFSGNGEPTINPHFAQIVDITLSLRDLYYPQAKVSVLSNSSMLWKKQVREALMKIDNPILKIDSAIESYVNNIDRPNSRFSLEETIKYLKMFNGNFILQTMFLKGSTEVYTPGKGVGIQSVTIDCTDKEHCRAWVELAKELRPRDIMMYTLDRDTPAKQLEKVSIAEMKEIARPLIEDGFKVQINGERIA